MKFRMSPYHIPMLIAMVIFSTVASVGLGIMAWYSFPNGFVVCSCMSLVMILSLAEAIREMRLKGFPWVSFASDGITMVWKLGVHEFISWNECVDTGVFIADYGGNRYTCMRYWLYFSKDILTYKQLTAKKRPKLKQSDFIMIEYRPEVLEELLKYIDKDDIRNLHLLKD